VSWLTPHCPYLYRFVDIQANLVYNKVMNKKKIIILISIVVIYLIIGIILFSLTASHLAEKPGFWDIVSSILCWPILAAVLLGGA